MREVFINLINNIISAIIPIFIIYYFLPKFKSRIKEENFHELKEIVQEAARYVEKTTDEDTPEKEKKKAINEMATNLLELQNKKCDEEMLKILIDSSLWNIKD